MPTPPDYAPALQVAQLQLRLQYQDLARRGTGLAELADAEFRCASQNGEDGVLLYLFSLLGTTNRTAVEICAGDGLECNSANLIVNHGWRALLFDGDAAQIQRGQTFYASCPATWLEPPTLANAWVTAENVNALVTGNGVSGPIDLLSLDLDGNDYWVWKALDCVTPRVVVLEFNAACGPEQSMAIAYDPNFRLDLAVQPYRCGASLPAFARLARTKGYRLIGIESRAINAFFVREGLGHDLLPERTVRECYEQNLRLRRWEPTWLDAMRSGDQRWVDV